MWWSPDQQRWRPVEADVMPRHRGRGQSGQAPVPDATRTMLEEVYREILRANRRGAA